MRNHDPLGAAIEDAGRVVRVVRGDPGDRRDPHAQCRDAYPGRGFERSRVVLEVDVDRVEAARRRNHRDVRSAQLIDPHAQHQFVGFQHLLCAVLADLRRHRTPPKGVSRLPSIPRFVRARKGRNPFPRRRPDGNEISVLEYANRRDADRVNGLPETKE